MTAGSIHCWFWSLERCKISVDFKGVLTQEKKFSYYLLNVMWIESVVVHETGALQQKRCSSLRFVPKDDINSLQTARLAWSKPLTCSRACAPTSNGLEANVFSLASTVKIKVSHSFWRLHRRAPELLQSFRFFFQFWGFHPTFHWNGVIIIEITLMVELIL